MRLTDEILAWFRNPRLENPHAIIIATLLGSFVIVIGAKLVGESVLLALTAVGTIGAVVWAIFHQGILAYLQRPILEISPYDSTSPHVRRIREINPKTHETVGIGYYLTVQIENKGKALARKAQPLLTAMGRFERGQWRIQNNWIPVPVSWILDEPALIATGRPTEEKDLVQHRPYLFNLGCVSTRHPDVFHIFPAIGMPTNQPVDYDRGEFCFEITAFAEGANPVKKYFRIQWDGGCTDDFEDVKTKIKVFPADHQPWA